MFLKQLQSTLRVFCNVVGTVAVYYFAKLLEYIVMCDIYSMYDFIVCLKLLDKVLSVIMTIIVSC